MFQLDLAAVFVAGLLTLVTPCVLPLIPIYLALLMGGGGASSGSLGLSSRLGLLLTTAVFSLGFIVVFVALGLTATALGSLLTAHRTELVLLGALLIVVFGLKFLGVLHIGWLDREKRLDDRRFQTRFRLVNALVMGVVFALGWTPCVGPILGSVLTYAASAAKDPITGAAYLGVYGLGFALPLLVLSLFADAARGLVRRISPWLPRLERATGLLLVGVGVFLMLDVVQPPAADFTPTTPRSGGVTLDPPLGHPSPRPRMVEFITPSCSVCRQMIPTVAVIEKECGGRKVDVVKVDLSQDANRKLAADYRIRGVPTFVFLDRQGREAARLVGYQTVGTLRQALSVLVGDRCQGVGDFPFPMSEDKCQGGIGNTCKS